MTPGEQNSAEAFVRFLAKEIRLLPLVDGCLVLHGALIVGGHHEAIDPLRDIYASMQHSCDQLLSVGGQLELPLNGKGKQEGNDRDGKQPSAMKQSDPAQEELPLSSIMAHARFPGRVSLYIKRKVAEIGCP